MDSEGKVLEDIAADSKLAKIDFCEQILDEQFEYHQHMKVQDVLELEIVTQEDHNVMPEGVMLTIGHARNKVNLLYLDHFSQTAYANFMREVNNRKEMKERSRKGSILRALVSRNRNRY